MINKKIIVVTSAVLLLSSCVGQVEKGDNNRVNTEVSSKIEKVVNTEVLEEDTNALIAIKADEDAKLNENGLSEDEKNGLILMREEEKLARDVYYYFFNKYGQKIFGNIDDSEEKHKSAVKPLLDKYGIEDPIKDDSYGVFTSPAMDKLYNDLKSKGDSSLVDALIVGATIEDLDIKDLNELLLTTKDEDIIVVYKNLLKGSYNHMRSFVKNLDKKGGNYTPQFISIEVYEKILEGK